MFALIKVAENTYYIQNPSKIGIYVEPDGSATVIDAGMGDSAGERVVKILDKNGWKCARIINTPAHVDHVGGDRAIIAATGVSAYVPEPEIYTGHNPFMEPSAMYGGYPFDRVRERYGEPHIAPVKGLGELELPAGFAIERLDGHCGAMAAIKTPDDVWFVGDAVIDPVYLEGHGIAYNWNIAETLDSIEKLKTLKGRLFVPSHTEPVEDIVPLADANRHYILAAIEWIRSNCGAPRSVDELTATFFTHWDKKPLSDTWTVTAATVRSMLTYLHDRGEVEIVFVNNIMKWLAK